MDFLIHKKIVNHQFNSNDKHFVFIISSYNNEDYVNKNLNSVFKQTYKNWRIIYIDDASEDNTSKNVKLLLNEESIFKNKVKLISNKTNMKQAYNRFNAYKLCEDQEIICFLDGDDWLYDENVLLKLNEEYKTSEILLTYGSYIQLKNGESKLIKPITYGVLTIHKNLYRKNRKWVGIPMRTGYAFLYKYMPESNMKDHLGKWMSACTDVAEFLWAIECTKGYFKEINYPTYVYNTDASKRFSNSMFNLSDEQYQYRLQNSNKIYNYKPDN